MEAILTRVQKPARYVGGEWGSVMKDKKNVDLRFAFCFPDTYEVAMSHLGSRILYGLLNDQKGIWCERVYAPWIDMEAKCVLPAFRFTVWKAVIRSRTSILLRLRFSMSCRFLTF